MSEWVIRVVLATCRLFPIFCLSQIKSGHICDAVRRGFGGKEYALPSQQYAIGASLYSRTGACASHYSNSYTTTGHGEDAARLTRQRGQGIPVGSNRSAFRHMRSATGKAAMLAMRECLSIGVCG